MSHKNTTITRARTHPEAAALRDFHQGNFHLCEELVGHEAVVPVVVVVVVVVVDVVVAKSAACARRNG